MSTAIITVSITQLDSEDQVAIRHTCDLENKRRADASVELLDLSTGPLRKTYYESLLVVAMKEIHKRYVAAAARANDNQKPFQDMRNAWGVASPEQQAAALKALTGGV